MHRRLRGHDGEHRRARKADFVPVANIGEATLVVRRTPDQSLLKRWDCDQPSTNGIPLANPVQQIWDLVDLGGEDRAEAADKLFSAAILGAGERQ
jgi:hypothetical protein